MPRQKQKLQKLDQRHDSSDSQGMFKYFLDNCKMQGKLLVKQDCHIFKISSENRFALRFF